LISSEATSNNNASSSLFTMYVLRHKRIRSKWGSSFIFKQNKDLYDDVAFLPTAPPHNCKAKDGFPTYLYFIFRPHKLILTLQTLVIVGIPQGSALFSRRLCLSEAGIRRIYQQGKDFPPINLTKIGNPCPPQRPGSVVSSWPMEAPRSRMSAHLLSTIPWTIPSLTMDLQKTQIPDLN